MFALSAVDCWIKPKTIKLVFAASPLSFIVALMSKTKDWLAFNQNNVSKMSNMLSLRVLFLLS